MDYLIHAGFASSQSKKEDCEEIVVPKAHDISGSLL